MGQQEVLEAVARLNDRLNRGVTKPEVAEETGYALQTVGRSLVKLRSWNELVVQQFDAGTRKRMFRYTVPQHVREHLEGIEVDSS